jgi:hypothetical protein
MNSPIIGSHWPLYGNDGSGFNLILAQKLPIKHKTLHLDAENKPPTVIHTNAGTQKGLKLYRKEKII